MKTVIIGGGVAGLAMGIFLKHAGHQVVVNERSNETNNRGNAFLMHDEGVSILKELDRLALNQPIPGKFIDHFSLKNEKDEEIKLQKLDPWHCMKRSDVISYLNDLIPSECVVYGREFSHFIFVDEKAVAAVFKNGAVEYGDIFIGADGGGSLVRQSIFGPTAFTKTEVKEVLGILKDRELSQRLGRRFTKFQHEGKSINFGIIPSSEADVIWYIQYDPSIMDTIEESPRAMSMFCAELLKDFPDLVQEVMAKDDFEETYIWHTRDFDLLPSFHQKNIVLIGDAAHLALPFTSAGTTNALVDAHTLCNLMSTDDDLESIFKQYHLLRASHVEKQIRMGREIKMEFLNPQERNMDDNMIPLITRQKRAIGRKPEEKEIQIIYFTDPICSTCWTIQPQLRKLQMDYEEHVHIEYKMGGLLPSWNNFNRHGITKPSDVAIHWEEVCSFYEMPVNKQVWLEDPIPSSFPPSIAFKAAQIQDTGKAILFLRRIREMVFMEKKNIIKREYIHEAAYEVGLDAAKMLRDLEGKAQQLFEADIRLSQELEIKVLPTLYFINRNQKQRSLNGYQPYSSFEQILLELAPHIRKRKYDTSPNALFEKFQTLSTREFALLRNESEFESQFILNEMLINNLIREFESPTGSMWISNFEQLRVTA